MAIERDEEPDGLADDSTRRSVSRSVDRTADRTADRQLDSTSPRISDLKLANDDLVVMSFPIPTLRVPNNLTAAEHHVVGLLLDGCSVAEIAEYRGSAQGTINKQLGSIYRKAGVRSLSEFLAWASKGGPP